jgi:hypothetical protein
MDESRCRRENGVKCDGEVVKYDTDIFGGYRSGENKRLKHVGVCKWMDSLDEQMSWRANGLKKRAQGAVAVKG